mgnify:CR=1 FL=1
MKNFGYHRLILPTGEVVDGPLVVVMDDYHRMHSWHILEGEEPMVEWIGGTFNPNRSLAL